VSLASETVDYFRGEWAGRFVDTCVVTRPDLDDPSFDENTGQTTYPPILVYDGECLVRPAQASEADYGEARRQVVDYDAYFPHDSAELEEGDKVTVASERDPNIPVLGVLRDVSHDSYLTRRHYECEVVVG
jgi:hypothetical protein